MVFLEMVFYPTLIKDVSLWVLDKKEDSCGWVAISFVCGCKTGG